MQHILSDREVGQYPLSIATSLALEGATGIYPERETHRNHLVEYDEFWVNLRTLYRNAYNAVGRESQDKITASAMLEALMQEIETLETIVLEKTSLSMKIVYYVSNYAGMAKKYPKAVLKEPRTDKQRMYAQVQKLTITALLEELGKQGGRDVRVFDLKLTPKNPAQTYGKALILTHYAYDLFSRTAFSDLELLESHTGVIKPRAQWYTKYTDGKGLSMIPFREDLIQIFGDSELFSAWNIKERRQLIELATERKWHAMTTLSKIRSDLGYLKNPYLIAQVSSVLMGI